MTASHLHGTEQRLVTCIMPAGRGRELLRRLKREQRVVSVSLHHARGVNPRGAWSRRLFFAEKDVLVAMVEPERAEEVFAFLYRGAGLDEPHAGLVFMERVARGVPLALDIDPAEIAEE